jgi:hypothetical protein
VIEQVVTASLRVPITMPKATTKFADSLVMSVRKKIKGVDFQLASAGSIMSEVREWIPTGFPGLDFIFGGGWPVGRCSEVAGEEGCGGRNTSCFWRNASCWSGRPRLSDCSRSYSASCWRCSYPSSVCYTSPRRSCSRTCWRKPLLHGLYATKSSKSKAFYKPSYSANATSAGRSRKKACY